MKKQTEKGLTGIEVVVVVVIVAVLGAAVLALTANKTRVPSVSLTGPTVTVGESVERLTEEQVNSEASTRFEQSTEENAQPEGPATTRENFSSTQVTAEQRGRLKFSVTDPGMPEDVGNQDQQGNRGQDNRPTQAQDKKPETTPGATQAQDRGGPTKMSSLVVDINRVEVHLAEKFNEDGSKQGVSTWETLNLDKTQADLIALREAGSVLATLGVTELAAGKYTQIRLFVNSATGTTENGKSVPLEIPTKSLKIVREFEVQAGKTTAVTVDFDADRMVTKAADSYRLRPVVGRVIVEPQS